MRGLDVPAADFQAMGRGLHADVMAVRTVLDAAPHVNGNLMSHPCLLPHTGSSPRNANRSASRKSPYRRGKALDLPVDGKEQDGER
ncbi:hypothetical protein D3C72_2003800 [compost metagenome]